jgi:O-antigen/teichoic acid export membrane protein
MFKSIFKSPLARNAAWMFVGQGLRLVLQAFYFIEIARSLGVSNYGAFVGVVSLVGIFFPFGGMGSGNLLVQNVAREPDQFRKYWGKALATTTTFSSILLVVVLLVSSFALPRSIPILLVFLVAASDLFGLNIITISGQAFQVSEQLNWTASLNVMISLFRLAGAVGLAAIYTHPSALQWGYIYCGSTALSVAVSVLLVSKKLGAPQLTWRRSMRELREGFYFSAGLSSQTIYNDIDKTMLARMGTLDATGIYGAAYRIIDVSFSPVSALLAATYPSFFRRGTRGISSNLTYAGSLLPRALGYTALACICLLLGAGTIPRILGPEYARSAEALRWLSVLPMLKAVHYFLSDALTGAGHQVVRTAIQVGVAIFNVLLNLWLIPAYSWRGAAWSSIASDALLACSIGAASFILLRRSQNVLGKLTANAESD